MDKEKICKVCNSDLEIKYGVCTYCNYNNRLRFTAAEDEHKAYKESILNSISNVSIEVGVFKYDDSIKKMKKIGVEPLSSGKTNGKAIFLDPLFFEQWITHFVSDTDIVIKYKFDSVDKSTMATISHEEKEGIWYLGLLITDDLRMEVLLKVVSIEDPSSVDYFSLAKVNLDLIA